MHGSISSAATARSAREQRAQPGAALGAAGGGDRRSRPARTISPSTGVMLALAFPDRVARNRGNGSFVLANGRGAAVEQTSVAGARALYRGRRTDRHRGAAGASCWRRRSRRPRSSSASPTRSRAARRFRSIAAPWRCAARRKRTLHAITLSEAPMALTPSAETARIFADGLVAAGLDRLPWSKALEAMARPRDVPAQGGRRRAGRICPMRRWPRTARTGWCPRSTTRLR